MINKKSLIIISVLILTVLTVGIYWLWGAGNEKSLIQEFIKENLWELNQPDLLDVQKTENSTGQILYAADWSMSDLTFYTSLFYDDNNNPNLILFIPVEVITGDLNEDRVLSITKEFFKTSGEDWRCVKGNNGEMCESSWIDGENRRCTGIQNIFALNISILYTRKISSGSDEYNQNGCGLMWQEI